MKEIVASFLLFVITVHLLGCCTGLECKIGSVSNNTIGTCP
uniref:Late nodulin n=1 Tax=Globodera pallida TaxID=36090 RepID=A0A183CSN2_GLOPA